MIGVLIFLLVIIGLPIGLYSLYLHLQNPIFENDRFIWYEGFAFNMLKDKEDEFRFRASAYTGNRYKLQVYDFKYKEWVTLNHGYLLQGRRGVTDYLESDNWKYSVKEDYRKKG